MARYWFRPKKLGWGVTPISIEGWVATLVFTLFIILNAITIFELYPHPLAFFKFIFDTTISSIVFLLLVKRRIKGDIGI